MGGRTIGAAEQCGICADAVIAAALIQSTPNTLSVSNMLMLRNMLRYREEAQVLRDDPARIDAGAITEFLRRDNHVKSLARQVHNNFELRGHELKRGDSLYIFYPGVNLDPNHWETPLALTFDRKFTHENQLIFGGSKYFCIGSRIALKYFLEMVPMMLQYLPSSAELITEEMHVDGSWVTERVIANMPIVVPQR